MARPAPAARANDDADALAADLARLDAGEVPAVPVVAAGLRHGRVLLVEAVRDPADGALLLGLRVLGRPEDPEPGGPMLLGSAGLGAASAALAKAERALARVRRRGGGRALLAKAGAYAVALAEAAGWRRVVLADLGEAVRGCGLLSVPAGDVGVLAAALGRAEARLRCVLGGTVH